MAIMAIYRSAQIDRETFNRYRVEAPIEPVPKGAIFHQVTFDEEGLLVIDVWESEEAMRPFNDERVIPALERLGLTPVAPKILQLHALWAAPDASDHIIPAPLPAAETADA